MVIIGKVLSAAVKMEHRWIFDEVIKICDLVFADQVILQLFFTTAAIKESFIKQSPVGYLK